MLTLTVDTVLGSALSPLSVNMVLFTVTGAISPVIVKGAFALTPFCATKYNYHSQRASDIAHVSSGHSVSLEGNFSGVFLYTEARHAYLKLSFTIHNFFFICMHGLQSQQRLCLL